MKIYSILLIVLLAIQYGYPQKIKRTYRIAIAATGEYTQFHGGTKVSALAAIRASLHQINEIYRKELAIEFELVANNEDIIFTDPNTDPFTKTLPSQLILENQKVIDNYIGNENYDIGHLLSAMPLGSHASLATTCRKGLKARGISTHASPEETHFNIGILAHEIGHQLGAQHTFNGIGGSCLSDSRNEPTAVEPGSGESIMSYAGLCDAQNTSTSTKAFFHYTSLSQIQDQLLHGAVGTCPVKTVSNNQIPKINLAKNTWYISANTPFALTGSATDTNDANLLFSWEQIDTGKIDANENSRFGTLFQSYLPSTSKTRTFPKLPLLLNGINTQFGEALPTEARVLNFAFTVRDHHSRGGAFASEKVQLRVIDSKPFEMLMGTKTLYWTGGETQKIQWDVSSTKDKPIQANYVNIWFSEDGGLTFPYLLASQTLNDGSEYVHIPNIETKLGRVKIQPVNHIFFAVNQAYIQVASNTSAYFTLHKLQSTYTLCHNTPLISPLQVKKHRAFSGTVTLRAQLPTAWQATFTQTQIKPPFTAYCHVSVKNANYSVLREGQLQIQAVGKKWSQRQDIQLSYRKVPRVENLVITQVSHNEIKLQWSSITEGTQVLISQSLGADFSIIGIEKALENHYTVPHLDTNTLYYYTARAQDANCVSDLSNIASKTTLKRIIEPPSDISFTEVKPTSLSISWKDNSKNEHLFKLYRRQKGSNTFEELAVLPVNSTYFKDVSVAQGTAYEYQVCAHIGTVSFECSTIAIAKTPPLPVSDFSYKYLTTHTVVLHWKASLKSGFYTIRRKKLHHGDVPIVEIKIPHSISQFVDTDLEEGIQYEYEITSENEVGTSTTTSLFITTPIEEIPQSPEELDAVQVGQTEANLIWKDQSSNERGFVVFRAEKGKAFVPIANLYENINHYRDRFLQPEKSYRYRVQAYNEKGTSNYSNILNVNTLPYPPQIPQWIKFEEIEQPRVHLEWSSVANASHYRIERKFMNTSFIKIGTTKNTSFQDQNLQFARQYSYRIIAVNRGGDSRPSEEKSLTIIQKIPSPPTALTLVSVSYSQIVVSWKDNSLNEKYFGLYYSEDKGKTFHLATKNLANRTQYRYMNLTPQKEYYFKVNAENSGGMSTFSNTVKVLTPPSFPKIPTALSAKALSENSIQLRWKDKSHNETGFIIERTDYSSLIFRHIATLPTNTEVYTDTNLNSNIMYFYRIRSFNITGQSKLTSAVQAKTLMPRPAPPSSLKANLESEGKARIAWKDHSNLETGFTLEYANKFSNSFQVLKKVGKNITEVVVPLQYINVNYLFRIKAYNDTGSSKYSETISLFNHIYPPLLLRGKVKKHRTILLEWKDGSQYEENYIVEMRNSEDPKLKKIILPPNTERYEIGNLKENTLYYFRVYTIKNQFTSAYVDISLITPRTTFVIYPNPTFGKVGIKIEDDYLGKIYVDVFNNLGKEIVATTVEKTQLEITINFKLSDQPFGLYWIRVRRGSKVSIRSIIKE